MSRYKRYFRNELHLSVTSGRLFAALILLGLMLFGLGQTRVALAASFTVNTTADTVDANPGNGVCADGGGNCSLRAAVMETNALAGADTITLPAGTYILSLAGSDDTANAGDLDITGDLIINGAGAASTIVDGNNIDRVFHLLSGVTVTINDSKITGGLSGGNPGGGIYNAATLTVNNSVITNNSTISFQSGGGIANEFGTLTVNDSTISNNSSDNIGGGIYNDSGMATINNSAIINNISNSGNGGGGLYNSNSATMAVNNVTVSGNSAQNVGGGIFNSGPLTLKNSTVVSNTSDSDNDGAGDGGGILRNAGTVTIQNTIIANNKKGPSTPDDCSASADLSLSFSLLETITNCTFTDGGNNITAADPLLNTLADNGGNTQTHALQATSPAIDAGDDTTCLSTDQIGTSRPQGNGCDMGAFELIPTPAPGGVDTNLQLWLKANAGVTTSGNSVTNWSDQSGIGNNVSQGTGASQPTLQTNAINGNPALLLDGNDQYLRQVDEKTEPRSKID